MSDDGPTLQDMLAMVPRLLTMCALPYEIGNQAVRVLRLVGKGFSCIAMREVKKCSLQLGAVADLAPHQVVKMMHPARLLSLQVTVSTTSGRFAPSLAQQLATCTCQLAELLQGMETAISTVRHLNFAVCHAQMSSGTRASASSTEPLVFDNSPAPFSAITRALCTMLAAALPSLEILCLKGCCRDAALPAFGASCPKLSSLSVQAISVSLKALKDMGQHLPFLQHFTLTSQQLRFDHAQLTDYIDASIHALRESTSIATINLCLDTRIELECKPGTWQQVPSSLEAFNSTSKINGIQNATALLSVLHYLCLENNSDLNIAQILRQAPLLKHLDIPGPAQWVLWCDRAETMTDMSLLQKRLLAGLRFEVEKFHLFGLCSIAQAVLALLPPLPDVQEFVLHVSDEPALHCLDDVVRAFPSLTTFKLRTHNEWPELSELGTELLEPLLACTNLQSLQLRVELTLTTASLLELCQKMPGLRELAYTTIYEVDLFELRFAFEALGREMEVWEIPP